MDELKPCHLRQVDNNGRILCNAIKGGDREVSVQLCRACPVSQINCQNLRAGLEKKTCTPITVRFATGRVEVWDDAPPQIDFKQAACAAKTMPIHSPRDCAGCPIRLPNVIPQNAIQVAHRAKQNAPVVPQAPMMQQTPVMAQAPVVAQAAAAPRAARKVTRASAPAFAAVAQAQAAPVAQVSTPAPTGSIDLGMASDLVARAQATAARKAQEKQVREMERAAREEQEAYSAQPEPKKKIIQLQEWLAGQIAKKQGGTGSTNSPYKPQAVPADADGVSDIVYSPLGAQMANAYQETIDYERCVGWTD